MTEHQDELLSENRSSVGCQILKMVSSVAYITYVFYSFLLLFAGGDPTILTENEMWEEFRLSRIVGLAFWLIKWIGQEPGLLVFFSLSGLATPSIMPIVFLVFISNAKRAIQLLFIPAFIFNYVCVSNRQLLWICWPW